MITRNVCCDRIVVSTSATKYASHILDQQGLPLWSVCLCRCFKGSVNSHKRVGLPYSLCAPVDSALLPHLYRLLRARVSLAPGPSVDAKAFLHRLQSSTQASSAVTPQDTLAIIVYTDNLENKFSVGTSYLDCFVIKTFALPTSDILSYRTDSVRHLFRLQNECHLLSSWHQTHSLAISLPLTELLLLLQDVL